MTEWNGRKVLVTGAYGFLAAHLIEGLLRQGAQVVGLVRDCPAESYLQYQYLDTQITLLRGDVGDLEFCRRALNEEEVEVVFHLAAQAIVGTANRSPLSTFESNIRATYVLLEACREMRVDKGPLQGVVVASSDKAYGDQDVLPYREDAPMQGLHPYDVSKSCADLITRTYANTYKLPVAVTRCANLFGPGDLNFSRIVPATVRDVLQGTRPVIRSDGSPQRDYLYVGDAVEGYLALADAVIEGKAAGRAYNLGTGVPVTVLELVNDIIAAAGSDLTAEVQNTAGGEIRHQYLDPARAREELGWEARTPREVGLKDCLQWYSEYLSDKHE